MSSYTARLFHPKVSCIVGGDAFVVKICVSLKNDEGENDAVGRSVNFATIIITKMCFNFQYFAENLLLRPLISCFTIMYVSCMVVSYQAQN